MGSLGQTVLLCIGVELAVVWVLRERTSLLRRTSLHRLLYVAGLGTVLTLPIGLMIAKDAGGKAAYPAAVGIVCVVAAGIETGMFRTLGRLGWRKALVFSACTNAASLLVLLALHALRSR